MKGKMKKIISLVLVLAISFTISIPAFAAEKDENTIYITQQADGNYTIDKNAGSKYTKSFNNNPKSIPVHKIEEGLYKNNQNTLFSKVNNTTFVPVEEVNINPLDEVQVENAISKYGLHKQTAQGLKDYSEKCIKGEINPGEGVVYYAPLTLYKSSSNSTRTYSGYGIKRYYEEKIKFTDHSKSEIVNVDTWGQYKNSVVKCTAKTIFDGVIDYISGGVWSIASIFVDAFPSSVPSANGKVTHEANKQEQKTKVWTYVSESDGYHFGCLTEYSWAYFQNQIIYDGGKYAQLYSVKQPK